MDKTISIFKALSDKNRMRMVLALIQHEELCACQLTELIQVTGATASRHMGVLIASTLVESRKEGRWVYYRLCTEKEELKELISWIERKLKNDPLRAADSKTLYAIKASNPEDICRKQRGEKCCPKKIK